MTTWVFNVERGLCVLVKTPSGHGVMIDCGRSPDWSPVKWIVSENGPALKPWISNAGWEYKLARLIVTHPHDDHVEDISNLKAYLPPGILSRHKDYDWEAVLNPPDCDPSANAKEYFKWQATYTKTIPNDELPDLGCWFKHFALTPSKAAELNTDSQRVLNNSSYICVFNWPLASGYWKLVICGDNETNGLKELLKRQDFSDAIAGTDFFVTPHHGHNSGYCAELFEAMGKPLCNITSEKASDDCVACEYSIQASGADFKGEKRQHLTTRHDGHIVLKMNDTGYSFL